MQREVRWRGVTWLANQVEMSEERPKFPHPRLEWMLLYEQKKNARAICKRFGISRKTFYKWLKRYRESRWDPSSLTDRSRRPHHSPRATPPEVVDFIVRAKGETGYGQRRLKQYLAREYNIFLSERTIWRLLKRRRQEEAQKQAETLKKA